MPVTKRKLGLSGKMPRATGRSFVIGVFRHTKRQTARTMRNILLAMQKLNVQEYRRETIRETNEQEPFENAEAGDIDYFTIPIDNRSFDVIGDALRQVDITEFYYGAYRGNVLSIQGRVNWQGSGAGVIKPRSYTRENEALYRTNRKKLTEQLYLVNQDMRRKAIARVKWLTTHHYGHKVTKELIASTRINDAKHSIGETILSLHIVDTMMLHDAILRRWNDEESIDVEYETDVMNIIGVLRQQTKDLQSRLNTLNGLKPN